MRKLALVITTFALLAMTAGASAATAEQPVLQTLDPEAAITSQAAQPIELGATEGDCHFGQPSCFKDSDCDDYCGVGWGDCSRWCCWCLG
jgi:hypothetical protein